MDGKAIAFRDAGFQLPDASLERLAGISREQRIDRGEYLFHKGDPCTALHVILDGTLQAVSTSVEGQDLVFGEFGAGGVIGELTVLDGADRSSSVRATKATTLLTVSRRELLELARTDAEVAIGIAVLCARRARRLSEWAEGASFDDTVGRLAAMLVRLADIDPVMTGHTAPLKLTVTQQSLADQLGITRESTNKALRSLEDDGLVSLGRGSVTLVDIDELQWRMSA